MSSLLELESASITFLQYDSWLDCTQLMGGHSAQDLETILVSQSQDFKGRLDANVRRKVRAIVTQSAILSELEKAQLLALW